MALPLEWIRPSALVPVATMYLAGIGAAYAVLIMDDLVFGTYRRTRDRLRMIVHALFEQLVFRPMTLIWRIWGLTLFLKGRTEWGAQERRGIAA